MGQKSPNLTKLKIFDYLKMLPSYDIPNNFLVPRMNESESKPYSYMRSATQQLTKKKSGGKKILQMHTYLISVFLQNNNFGFWICMGLQKKLYEILKAYVVLERVFLHSNCYKRIGKVMFKVLSDSVDRN